MTQKHIKLTNGPDGKPNTRLSLLSNMVDMVGAGRSFSSISIRELTQSVGIVPSAFYRHFRNMDALGLTIVEDRITALRHQLKEVRAGMFVPHFVIRDSVHLYIEAVQKNANEYLFLVRESMGGSPVLQRALRLQLFKLRSGR
jgi:AcrR family transcriptional regulator